MLVGNDGLLWFHDSGERHSCECCWLGVSAQIGFWWLERLVPVLVCSGLLVLGCSFATALAGGTSTVCKGGWWFDNGVKLGWFGACCRLQSQSWRSLNWLRSCWLGGCCRLHLQRWRRGWFRCRLGRSHWRCWCCLGRRCFCLVWLWLASKTSEERADGLQCLSVAVAEGRQRGAGRWIGEGGKDVLNASQNQVIGRCKWHCDLGWEPRDGVANASRLGLPDPYPKTAVGLKGWADVGTIHHSRAGEKWCNRQTFRGQALGFPAAPKECNCNQRCHAFGPKRTILG
jgi:hypothetical protein